MASDRAEIDARVAYYVAVENANCAQNVAIVEANAESTRCKLDFLTAWGECVVEVAWKLDNPDYDSYNYSYMNYYSTDLPTTLTATPTFGARSNNVSTQFTQVPVVLADSAVECNESTLWNAFRSLDASVVSMRTQDAQLRGEAERASAASVYVELRSRDARRRNDARGVGRRRARRRTSAQRRRLRRRNFRCGGDLRKRLERRVPQNARLNVSARRGVRRDRRCGASVVRRVDGDLSQRNFWRVRRFY